MLARQGKEMKGSSSGEEGKEQLDWLVKGCISRHQQERGKDSKAGWPAAIQREGRKRAGQVGS